MTPSSGAPVRAAMLGSGAWAGVLASSARQSEHIDLVSCWGRSPDRVAAFATAQGLRACTELDQILHDEAIEAVIIALSNECHREFAERAAAHGKHVFIEKPIAHTLEDGLAVADLERSRSVQIAVGHCARMLAGNRVLAGAARSGELGRVTQLEAVFCNDRGLRLTPQDWRWYRSSAPGGPLSQIAIHQLDVFRAIGGDLRSVSARSARLSGTGAEVEDQWVIAVEFTDGKLGSLVSSWTSPGRYGVRVSGDRASLWYEVDQTLWAQPDRLHEGAVLERQESGRGVGARTRLDVPVGNMVREELDLFAGAVREGTPCELSAANACHALAAVNAALASAARHGASVGVDETIAAARQRAIQ